MFVRPSFRLEHLDSHCTDFHEIWLSSIIPKSVEKIRFSLKAVKNDGHFVWRPIYISNISRPYLIRMRNVSNKICRENQNTYLMLSSVLFRKSCRLWDNVEKYCGARQATDDHKIRHMRFAFRITTATNTHLEYVIRIPFPQQQWLHERASILHFTYIAFPVPFMVCSLGHAYSSCAVWRLVFRKLHNSVLVIHFYEK
jgi:hypothetical protein